MPANAKLDPRFIRSMHASKSGVGCVGWNKGGGGGGCAWGSLVEGGAAELGTSLEISLTAFRSMLSRALSRSRSPRGETCCHAEGENMSFRILGLVPGLADGLPSEENFSLMF